MQNNIHPLIRIKMTVTNLMGFLPWEMQSALINKKFSPTSAACLWKTEIVPKEHSFGAISVGKIVRYISRRKIAKENCN